MCSKFFLGLYVLRVFVKYYERPKGMLPTAERYPLCKSGDFNDHTLLGVIVPEVIVELTFCAGETVFFREGKQRCRVCKAVVFRRPTTLNVCSAEDKTDYKICSP